MTIVVPVTCFACGGPYHPASGHLWREHGVAYCGPCYRYFATWAKGHVRRKWSGADFYAEALVSCSAVRPT
jgi:hypothetical protein